MISLDEYIQNMKAEQKQIYYIAADSVSSAKNTPFLEKLLEKDLEVCTSFSLPSCISFVEYFFKGIVILNFCGAGTVLS